MLTANGWFFIFLEVVVYKAHDERGLGRLSAVSHVYEVPVESPTFPTAASPSRTSLTLLLGFDCAAASAIAVYAVDLYLAAEVHVLLVGDSAQ